MTQDTKALIERLEKHGRWWKVGDDKSEQRARDCDRAADALEAAQKRIERYEAALRDCLRIIDETMKESGRLIEYGEEDPFRMGEWFEEKDIAAIESARTALTGGE